jgi:hypothetical protein
MITAGGNQEQSRHSQAPGLGYGHIAAGHAEAIERFYGDHFNPLLKLSPAGGVPEIMTSTNGKQRQVYRWYRRIRRIPAEAERVNRTAVEMTGHGRRSRSSICRYAGVKLQSVLRQFALRARTHPMPSVFLEYVAFI